LSLSNASTHPHPQLRPHPRLQTVPSFTADPIRPHNRTSVVVSMTLPSPGMRLGGPSSNSSDNNPPFFSGRPVRSSWPRRPYFKLSLRAVLHPSASSFDASAAIVNELVIVEHIVFVALFRFVDLCVIQVFLGDFIVKGLFRS
jgi:hypothetical protein